MPRSPTPTAGGSTPSGPAPGLPAASRDVSTLTTAEVSQAAVAQRVEHRPVQPEVAGASPVGGAVPMVCHGHLCRRGRMDKAPVYETGGCRFDPCRRRSTRRSSVDRAPPSEGGGRTFDSCRRGHAQPGRTDRSDATERGSFSQQHPAGEDPAASRRGNAGTVLVPAGSRIVSPTWSSSNGEDASTPRSRCGFDSRRPHQPTNKHQHEKEG